MGLRVVCDFLLIALRLCAFALCLLPVLVKYIWWYLKPGNVLRNVTYGHRGRNKLDLYLPTHASPSKPVPVVVFLAGGAWMIGNKAWGCIIGRALKEAGVVCVMPDYRNFPQGLISDMLEDVSASISWTFQNILQHGGDPRRIWLVGQSAGAHLGALAMLEQAKAERDCVHRWESGDTSTPRVQWKSSQLAGFVGVSGPYDLPELRAYWAARKGRDVCAYLSQMTRGGNTTAANTPTALEASMLRSSPFHRIRQASFAHRSSVVGAIPPVALFHGTSDLTVPTLSSEEFASQLRALGAKKVNLTHYQGKTHTDPIIEDLLSDPDDLSHSVITDILGLVLPKGKNKKSRTASEGLKFGLMTDLPSKANGWSPQRTLVRCLIRMARYFNPF